MWRQPASLPATVNTELNDYAYLYPKLQSMLHSIKIETSNTKKPEQEAEARLAPRIHRTPRPKLARFYPGDKKMRITLRISACVAAKKNQRPHPASS